MKSFVVTSPLRSTYSTIALPIEDLRRQWPPLSFLHCSVLPHPFLLFFPTRIRNVYFLKLIFLPRENWYDVFLILLNLTIINSTWKRVRKYSNIFLAIFIWVAKCSVQNLTWMLLLLLYGILLFLAQKCPILMVLGDGQAETESYRVWHNLKICDDEAD